MNEGSFVKLHRKFLSWEWYDDQNTKAVFLHLLLIANWKDTRWRGIELHPGDVIRTNENLANELSLSVRNVRTAISRLIMTAEVTVRKEGRIRVITVKNWARYQQSDSKVTANLTPSRQQSDSLVTADKEIKERKNNKNLFFKPTAKKIADYFSEQSFQSDPDEFRDYYDQRGWKGITDWQAAARRWERRYKSAGDRPKFDRIENREYDFETLEDGFLAN